MGSVRKRAVYTILLGGYEELLPQPVLRDTQLDAFCFTDDPELRSDEWNVVQVGRSLPGDVVRSQRRIKVQFADYLSGYDEVLYLDNTVSLKQLPETILDEWLKDSDMALIEHSYREHLIDEFDDVARLNYDDAIRVHEQLWDYSQTCPEVLQAKPLWTGLMARRAIPEVNAAMSAWYEHILRYSRRDQLSVLAALNGVDFRLRQFRRDNFESEWHTWKVSSSRRVQQGKRAPLPSGPLIADLERKRSELSALQEGYDGLVALKDELLVETERLRPTAGQLDAARQEIHALEKQLQAIRSSTSWRVTAPIRRILGARFSHEK